MIERENWREGGGERVGRSTDPNEGSGMEDGRGGRVNGGGKEGWGGGVGFGEGQIGGAVELMR